jgi:hypothetical protein
MYIRDQTYRALGESVGPFEGTFTGTVTGDGKTTATITAQLAHRDTKIKGNVLLGRGLRLGFGIVCPREDVDLTQIPIDASADPTNPRRFKTATQVREPTAQLGLAFLKIDVTVTADLSADGRAMSADVTLHPVMGVKADGTDFTIPPCTTRALKVQLQRQ